MSMAEAMYSSVVASGQPLIAAREAGSFDATQELFSSSLPDHNDSHVWHFLALRNVPLWWAQGNISLGVSLPSKTYFGCVITRNLRGHAGMAESATSPHPVLYD